MRLKYRKHFSETRARNSYGWNWNTGAGCRFTSTMSSQRIDLLRMSVSMTCKPKTKWKRHWRKNVSYRSRTVVEFLHSSKDNNREVTRGESANCSPPDVLLTWWTLRGWWWRRLWHCGVRHSLATSFDASPCRRLYNQGGSHGRIPAAVPAMWPQRWSSLCCGLWLLQEVCWELQGRKPGINPFTPKSDQCQISPAASPKILHHTVWRTWLFIVYSDERWLYYQFSLPHLYISL